MRGQGRFATRMKAGLVGLSLLASGLAVAMLGATPAQASVPAKAAVVHPAFPTPTVWCQYQITATSGLNERWGPGLSYGIIRTRPYGQLVTAGKDGTVNADGYTWRQIADAEGGYSVSVYLSQTSTPCFS
jgi:hypothetical protein